MSVGFRKSFLGFNCDDVMAYVEKNHKTHNQQIATLNESIRELSDELAKTKQELTAVCAERNDIAAQLKEYTDKYDEIGRLSENIGKLYLVAQANAQAIMKNSQESNQMSQAEVERNLLSLEEAHGSLDQMRENLLQVTNGFSEKVNDLLQSLEQTKAGILDRAADSTQKKDEFAEVYQMLTK